MVRRMTEQFDGTDSLLLWLSFDVETDLDGRVKSLGVRLL